MKSQVLSFCFALLTALAAGQNLVPNPSFEEYVDCPYGTAGLNSLVVDWYSFAFSPDFFHVCSNSLAGLAGVPENVWGYQYPISGDGYAAYYAYTTKTVENLREYMAAPLIEPLIVGQTYYVMYYASQIEGETGSFPMEGRCACNNLGVRFMTNPTYSQQNPLQPDNVSHLNYPEILADSENWTKIEGWFTADEAYNWIVLGNFYEDSQTEILIENEWGNCLAVYFIENVCVALNPDDCDYLLQTGDLGIRKKYFHASPNPTDGLIHVKFNEGEIGDIYVLDNLGRLHRHFKNIEPNSELDLSALEAGIYFIKVLFHSGTTITKKIIKQ
jgi:hypothetical protein